MADAAVFSVLSKCFGPVEEEEWRSLTSEDVWGDFLDGLRRLLQEGHVLGAEEAPVKRLRESCPLLDFLSPAEVNALFGPPTFEEKQAFAARHFTGGLPESAVPVESLYTEWQGPGSDGALFGAAAKNLYLGRSADYLKALCASLGLQVPDCFSSCPDHLALELDVMAVLLRSGMAAEASVFLSERFAWLTAYRLHLLDLKDDARFYLGLVDALLSMRAGREAEADGGVRKDER